MSGAKGAPPPRGYKLIGVRADGTIVETRNPLQKSPGDAFLCQWGFNRKCAVVIRFWPSLKGWRALDIRAAREGAPHYSPNGGHSYPRWVGQVRGKRVFPNEDAAVMHAMFILGRQLDLAI